MLLFLPWRQSCTPLLKLRLGIQQSDGVGICPCSREQTSLTKSCEATLGATSN